MSNVSIYKCGEKILISRVTSCWYAFAVGFSCEEFKAKISILIDDPDTLYSMLAKAM